MDFGHYSAGDDVTLYVFGNLMVRTPPAMVAKHFCSCCAEPCYARVLCSLLLI